MNDRIIYANSYLGEILAKEKKVISEERIRAFLQLETPSFVLKSIKAGITDSVVEELTEAGKNLTIHAFLLNVEPHGQSVLILIQDMTAFKVLDTIKTEFVSNMLHRIRTPLTTIKSGLSILPSKAPSKSPKLYEDVMAMCRAETDRLILLLNNLRDLFMIDMNLPPHESVKTLFPVDKVVGKALEAVQRQATSRNVRIDVTPDRSHAILEGDENRYCRALTNILMNAVTFSGDGGIVTISVTDEGQNLRISVIDEGIGIPKEDLKRIFQKYYIIDNESSRERGGFGLGLYIAKNIINQMGGQLYVYSDISQGSQFDMVFPR
ncbi:ATP-binding protein [bacterium]|nr:ATP-binding protein [candidate division CSSED10-310 bacterium]